MRDRDMDASLEARSLQRVYSSSFLSVTTAPTKLSRGESKGVRQRYVWDLCGKSHQCILLAHLNYAPVQVQCCV